MRSVFAHLKNATKQEVRDWLSTFVGGPSVDGKWRYPNENDTVLYIDFYEDHQTEFEPEEYERLVAQLGCEPCITVVADVSGRVAGTSEVKYFIIELLKRFDGLASDDYSEHYWTYLEIEKDVIVDALTYFDFMSWR